MTWTTVHRRGKVLRTLTAAADARRDGRLPTDLVGVRETFGDELSVLAALQLRWHTACQVGSSTRSCTSRWTSTRPWSRRGTTQPTSCPAPG